MDKTQEHLQDIKEIRSIMERSSRFISLSGLSGIFAGVFALAGFTVAYLYLGLSVDSSSYFENVRAAATHLYYDYVLFYFADGLIVLAASLTAGFILTSRKAKRRGEKIWDATAKRMLINLMIPLVTGGLFCLILLYHGKLSMVAPATLIFYGLALINASKYTLDDIRYLGICEIILGLIASVYVGYGFWFWAVGFGVLHIIYGTVMYYKYER